MTGNAALFGIGGERPQEILTPDLILAPLRALWGEIVCDPAGSSQHTIARVTAYESDDGLSAAWPDRTYCNPPFKHLRHWLRHMVEHSNGRSCMLAPVRTHRQWWRRDVEQCSVVVWLDPFAFAGYDQSFPAPACLLFTRESLEVVRLLFGHLGSVTRPPVFLV